MPFSAIICASRGAADAPDMLRASLHFAGQSLIEYQARQAAEAGARRVMILVSTVTPALSRAIDRLGADGIAVSMVRDMVSLVRTAPRDEDMLLVADGLVAGQRHYADMADLKGNTLLVLEDGAATAGFERLDAGQRWAGLARVSPEVLFGTLDLLGDWDLELTLARAVVQAGGRRILVPTEDVLEGRFALIDRQAGADLVAEALLIARPEASEEAGLEYYALDPIAARIAPALLRSQVPAMQVRIGAIALATLGLVAALLGWQMTAILVFLASLVLTLTTDRLVRLARRGGRDGLVDLIAEAIVLLGVVVLGQRAGQWHDGLYLALALGFVAMVLRGRPVAIPRWAVFTSGSALAVLLVTGLGGYFAAGLSIGVLLAILSMGWMQLSGKSLRA